MTVLQLRSKHCCYGGSQEFYQHDSKVIGLPMRFSIYQPPQVQHGRVPVLYFLAGLTCTEETFMIKAGAQQFASKYGLMLVSMDTSPRHTNITGETDHWDFGAGAGFYLDATVAPWSNHYRMESYITNELNEIIMQQFPAKKDCVGIFGHSMGGHGALTLALRHPDLYQSTSAFAPITAPSRCPWGQKALTNYLGENQDNWRQHDTVSLLEDGYRTSELLIDQGLNDQFLAEQLNPDLLEKTCKKTGQKLTLRYHEGYDHGYYFISSFIGNHIKHHHNVLTKTH